MLAGGVALLGDPSPWQAQATEILAAGPSPLTHAQRQSARYHLTDLLDDLTHATDPGERTVIAATAWTAVADQALALADHWTGTGKWLLRELRDLDHDLADQWLATHGDTVAIVDFLCQTLDQHGGPLFDGYHATGERPLPQPASDPAP